MKTLSAVSTAQHSRERETNHKTDKAPCLKYTIDFLKGLQNASLSQICPDAVKNGVMYGKEWARRGTQSFPVTRSTNRSVFARPFSHPNYNRMQHTYVPYFGNNQNNYGGFHSEEMNAPLEPIGSRRYNAQNRNHQNRNTMANNADNFAVNSHLLTESGQRYDRNKKNPNEEDEKPEWYIAGPSSPNDCIELHGFEGTNHDTHDNRTRNDQLGCVDGNISGGPTSGASSNNGSPPAKSTSAKVTFNLSKDAQRNKRPDVGRQSNWQNNYDNRQAAGAPFLNELFKNYSSVQNQSNLRGLTPIVSVQDIESTLLYDRLKFRPNTAGRFENHSQSDSRGQCQSFENGTTLAQENNVNRWFSQTLLNKGPQMPSEPIRSEELESKLKQSLKVNEKEVM